MFELDKPNKDINGHQLASELLDQGMDVAGRISMKGDKIRFYGEFNATEEGVISTALDAHVADPLFDSTAIVNTIMSRPLGVM